MKALLLHATVDANRLLLEILQSLVILLGLIDSTLSQNTAPVFAGCSGFNPTYISGTCAGLLILQEEAPIDTVLFTVQAFDAESDNVEFTITGDSTLIYGLKLVTNSAARRANVTINSRIDRESFGSSSITILYLRMNDFNGNIISNSPINIFIADTNDNSPEFKNLPYRWEIPENTVWTYQTSFNVTVTDTDSTIATYTFAYVCAEAGSNVFNETKRSSSALTSSLTGYQYVSTVSLMKPLDYETTRFYQVSVYAVEQATKGRNATTDIVLNVLDQQDTPPVFEGIPYVASVSENSPNGTLLTTVLAKDGDRGIPNTVEYYFDTSSSTTIAQLAAFFSLNRVTGRIEVAANIDRESSLIASVYSSFTLTVVAREVSAVSQPANISQTSTSLVITISDVNDIAPTFGQSNYNATVLENTAVGIPITLLTTCTVTDLDDRDNSVFNLTVSKNGSAFSVFDVSPVTVTGSGAVTLRVLDSSQLDYETVKSFQFEVVARETKTAARLSTTATFTVFLLDANDNAPIFNQSKYTFSVSENSPIGTVVGKVYATDLDSGTHGTITYSLGGTGANKFRIDPATGLIQVSVHADTDSTLLDRESDAVLYLTAQGTDGGGWTGIAQLEIQLLDRNDNRPAFPSSNFTYTRIKESYSVDYEIDSVRATDKDTGLNSALRYELQPYLGQNSSTGLRLFKLATVNATDGYFAKLTINDSLYGQIGWYNLSLIARDSGTPQLTGTTALTFYVAPADSGEVLDDSALTRFRSALISTTIILIGGCAVSLLIMIRTYFKSRALRRMYDEQIGGEPWMRPNTVGPMQQSVQPFPASDPPPAQPTGQQSCTEKKKIDGSSPNTPDIGLSQPDSNNHYRHQYGADEVAPMPDVGNPLFPRSFTLLKIDRSAGAGGADVGSTSA